MNRRHADFQSSEILLENKNKASKQHQDKDRTSKEPDTHCEEDNEKLEKEKPGALAGATGLDFQDWLSWIDSNLRRESQARVLARAIVECDPEDRLEFLESVQEFFSAGFPIPLLGSVMEQATFWAERSSRAETKAYALACFNKLSPKDQAAFLRHVQPPAVDV